MQKINPNTVLTVAGIGLLIYATKRALVSFGVIDDANVTKPLQILETQDYFNPKYFEQFKNKDVLILKSDYANSLCDIIHNAKGLFNDDEDAVYSVFEKLKTKSQVSFLALRFNERYNASLKNYLKSFLNNSEMANVANIINKLPSYKI